MKVRLAILTALVVLGCVMSLSRGRLDNDPGQAVTPAPVPHTIDDVPGLKGKVIVAFTAPWCGPCRRDKPTLHRIVEETQAELITFSFDTDRPQFPIPLYVVYVDGVEQFRTNSVEELH
jgi:thiol-disulfide isomerase/thioredoxin